MPSPAEIIPIYIVSGFLDSGKTTLIHNMLEDRGFSRGQKTLLVVCEEGEKEYDPEALRKDNVFMATADSVEQMTPSFFTDLNRKYLPERVIVEYNSMFTFEHLNTMRLPLRWELVQVIAMVDARTFDNYIVNMRQLMADPLQNADLILFNRCENGMNISSWRRQMRAMNSSANILFEFTDGHTDDGVADEDLPYDMKADVISVADDQFGTLYLDSLDHPERYNGKKLRIKGQFYREPGLPKGVFRFGREAMTCCANDIQKLGFPVKCGVLPPADKWVYLTAKAQTIQSQGQEMMLLHMEGTSPAVRPDEQYVTFS